MKYLVFTSEAEAVSLQARADVSTGYPRAPSGSQNAVGIEKHHAESRWAVGVATVWSWVHGRHYDIATEMLTQAERGSLVDFPYLVDEGWYPAD